MRHGQPQWPHLQQLLELVPQDDDLELSQDDLAALSLQEESESSSAAPPTPYAPLRERWFIGGREVRAEEPERHLTNPEQIEAPTTACFDCDAVVSVAETWVNKKGLALCEGCFTKREAKGRARRGRRELTPREQI